MTKYHNQRCGFDGYIFDSLAERDRYVSLKYLKQAGTISDLQVHPVFTLQDTFRRNGKIERGITYAPDFTYIVEGRKVAEDVKGVKTEAYRIKRKLFMEKYPEYRFVEINV